jgi:hypothetical protein
MEKFSGILYPTYQFTDQRSELPDFLLEEIQKALAIDWSKESFVASCWIQNMLVKGKTFVLVTDQRVAYSDTVRVNQNLLRDMTGVERNLVKNIKLLSPGNSSTVFPAMGMPVSKLLDRMFGVVNTTWNKSREVKEVAAQPTSNNTIQQIEQLNDLKNKGILTEEEFQQKKSELLARM